MRGASRHRDVESLRQGVPAEHRCRRSARTGGERFDQAALSLDRPASVDIYAVGEAREDGEFDFGWIINADTRERVWTMTWRDSQPAGGAEKNRRATRPQLPAGRYAAFYATDDSHDPSEWNAPPPHDPDGWGLTSASTDRTARAAVKTFAYEHVPAERHDRRVDARSATAQSRKQGFTLTRADGRPHLRARRRTRRADVRLRLDHQRGLARRVWEMRYDDTERAGGDRKNRLVDTTMHLDKGSYVVHYITDDSHSADEWNASAPPDGRHWGITVLAAKGPLDRQRDRALRREGRPVHPRAAHRGPRRRAGAQDASPSIARPTCASTRSARAPAATWSTTAGSRTRRAAGACGR